MTPPATGSQGPASHRKAPEPQITAQAADWVISDSPVDYEAAGAFMAARAEAIAAGEAGELVWLLEHRAIYTAGTSANPEDLLAPDRFEVFQSGRGGQYTYHGPGQRVAYTMLNVKRRGGDIRAFVAALEAWLIDTLAVFDVRGERRESRVGVWVRRPDRGEGVEDKIAAIGIRLRKWISFHGVSINVDPELEHYAGIKACGIADHGITSLADLGINVAMAEVDRALQVAFEARFGPICPRAPADVPGLPIDRCKGK